eukprot:scaffold6421_cov251-Ochromonas_danica.AAC.8
MARGKKTREPPALAPTAPVPETDYSSESYWNQRYEANNIDHEWYYSFDILEPLLKMMLSNQPDLSLAKALEIGCGDRPLVSHFHQLGLKEDNIYGIDFSQVVIDHLQSQQSQSLQSSASTSSTTTTTTTTTTSSSAKVHYLKADARRMSQFSNDNFDLLVDKGTIDSMLSSTNSKEGVKNAFKVVKEMVRLLSPTGSFMLISHIEVDSDEFEVLMDDILCPALQSKTNSHWSIKAHIIQQPDASEEEENKRKKRKKEVEVRSYGSIYIVTSLPRRQTRHSQTTPASVHFEVLEYTDSDDEEEGEGEESFFCQPCGP